MIYHKKCGSQVLVDVSEVLMLICTFGIGKTVLRVGVGDIVQKDLTSIPTVFYCSICGENHISFSDVQAQCSQCGLLFPLDSMFKAEGSGGIYCANDARTLCKTSELTPLNKICQKVSFR
jgi:hypothetical protein